MRHGESLVQRIGWVPTLGLDLVLRLDGLSWMFGVLVLGIGALIVLYARYYLSPTDPVPRFYAFLLAFIASMLGVVLSGNLLQLAFFWELTSLFSFLLIGYWNASQGRAARRAHGADRHRRRRPVPARRGDGARTHRRQLRARRGCSSARR